MHQPELNRPESSYFDYEAFPFVRPPEMDGDTRDHHPVAIIGAGPVGLMLAILLARHGLKPVLIEAEAYVCSGSRALALARRTMEIAEQCGCADAFLDSAIVWKDGYSFYKGRVVHHLDIPYTDDDKFMPMTNLAQCAIEKILVDRARELGVDCRFQTRLDKLVSHDDGVELTLDTPEGTYPLRVDWLAACDGARSSVRRLQGLRFEGNAYESRFVIADMKVDIDSPTGRRCYFDPPWLPGQSVLLHKAPDNIWRLDYQVPDEMSDDEALDRERLGAQINAHFAYVGVDAPWDFEWVTLYKPNALTLGNYRYGRVLYCGDAAHLLPVFGVRGMNTGVQDSINLAWKLAAVVNGSAPEALLDVYSSERVADARQICVEAGRSTRLMAPPSRGFRVMQQAVLSLALDQDWVRGLLHWRTSHPIDYADSPATWHDPSEAQFDNGPHPGAPPRNVRLVSSKRKGRGKFLLDVTGPGFTVLVFGNDSALWHAAAEDVRASVEQGLAVTLVAVRQDDTTEPGADATLADTDGRAHQLWGADDPPGQGTVYVLRPDQHIAARWKSGSPTRLANVLQFVLSAGAAGVLTSAGANAPTRPGETA